MAIQQRRCRRDHRRRRWPRQRKTYLNVAIVLAILTAGRWPPYIPGIKGPRLVISLPRDVGGEVSGGGVS